LDPSHSSGKPESRIGTGAIGSKAERLGTIQDEIVPELSSHASPGITVDVPPFAVVAADVFAEFMNRNGLWEMATAELSDNQIAKAFQDGQIPEAALDQLRGLVAEMRSPLALRSSTVVDRSMRQPIAGIHRAKLIANNQPDVERRLRRLAEALKFVWSSAFSECAVMSRRGAGLAGDPDELAVVVQEVAGSRHGDRYYPTLSGVARSYNHYPSPGNQPADGVVTLALGLGKVIAEDTHTWSYSPLRPAAPPPFRDNNELLKYTQKSCWAVNLADSPRPDPISDLEFLRLLSLAEAEADGELRHIASTYDTASDRLRTGLEARGPRALTFAPLLASRSIPFNELIGRLIARACEVLGGPAEIEFAATLDPERGLPMRISLLQLLPMLGEGSSFPIDEAELGAEGVLVASESCLGNGARDDLVDVVYLRPQNFERGVTQSIASELEAVNRGLVDEGRQAVLIGFGRWGTTDSRYGVPVLWRQISAARVIVEAAMADAPVQTSQGTHFYHRLLSYQVLCLKVEADSSHAIDWDWLDRQPDVWESRHVRHVRLEKPLEVRVDGATRRGVLRRPL
jgi:hypothetical protein